MSQTSAAEAASSVSSQSAGGAHAHVEPPTHEASTANKPVFIKRIFTPQYRQQATDMVLCDGLAAAEVARKLGMSDKTWSYPVYTDSSEVFDLVIVVRQQHRLFLGPCLCKSQKLNANTETG